MTLYCESSAILSVYLRELGRHPIVQRELEQEIPLSSVLASVEVRANLARAAFKERPRRLTDARYARALRMFESEWHDFFHVPITDELLGEASVLARQYLLRAYDAVHLASALSAQARVPDTLLLSTWDRDLAAAAVAAGLSLAHEVIA